MIQKSRVVPVLLLYFPAFSQAATFELLTWTDAQASAELPSAADRKPAPALPAFGDWLPFTPDDAQLPGFNPAGALSHSFADLTGGTGPGFSLAPSLTGQLSLELTPAGPSTWDVSVTGLAYTGQATPVVMMNQFLVTPGSAPAQNPLLQIDGIGNAGTWASSPAGNWAFSAQIDFYLATNADGDAAPGDVDATFNNALQQGYLIPVDQLTPAGLALVELNDPAGFFAGDFEQYLLDEIAPRLPADATFLLITQMLKTQPDYAEVGLPITTSSRIGNTTIAYTTQPIPEPATGLLALAAGACLALRRRRTPSVA